MTPYQRKVANATLCCSVSVIGFVVVTIAALAINQRARQSDDVLSCSSERCASATRYLSAIVEQDLHPCVDIHQHVCGMWTIRRHGAGFVSDAFGLFLRRFRSRLLQADDAVLGERMTPVVQIGKRLLEDCFEYMNATNPVLQRDISSLLYVLNVSSLLASESSSSALVRAMAISFTTGFHSAIVIARRKLDRGAYLHLLNAPSIRQELRAEPTDKYVETYVEDVVRHVAATSDAATIARDVLDVDSEVESFAELDVRHQWLTYGEIKEDAKFPKGVWSSVFQLFGEAGLTVADTDVLLFTGYEPTRRVFQNLTSAPVRTTVWYLTVTLLAQALRYDFTRRFRSAHYRETSYLCFDAVSSALQLHWHIVLRELVVGNLDDGISELNSMFYLIHKITVPDWLDNDTALQARQKIDQTSLETLAPSRSAVSGDVNTMYLQHASAAMAGSDRHFTGSYVTLRLASQQEAMLREPPNAVTARMTSLWAHKGPVYDVLYDKVFLPPVFLVSPLLYDDRKAPPFLYGTVGAALAKALSDAIGPYARWNATTPHTSHKTWWSSSKVFDAQLRLGCLRTRADEDVLRHPERAVHPRTSEAFKSSAFGWVRAARVAHDAMKGAHYDGGNRFTRDKYWPRAQRQFFKRFCLLSCGTERQDPLRPQERCSWPLISMPEFVAAFECRNESYKLLQETCTPF
ncbi:hypothetical protein V5799_027953 [Amblyomma americanum]|uniref:Uncharacterized protein n=1 Tax=Amblyomma americanum TaxID=6943 RepID=A0AAQ4DE92_AMBAM